MDLTGKEICEFKYDAASAFKNGLAQVEIFEKYTRKYGNIDKSGKEIIPCEFGHMTEYFSDNVIKYYKDRKYGFIGTNGKMICQPLYSEVDSLS
ncbi:MAG: WG repeat-containing protein, partial [Bacteroidota bacterium]